MSKPCLQRNLGKHTQSEKLLFSPIYSEYMFVLALKKINNEKFINLNRLIMGISIYFLLWDEGIKLLLLCV